MTDKLESPAGETAVLHVGALHYASEQGVVESVLSRRPGVLAVDANPVAQTASVRFDPGVISARFHNGVAALIEAGCLLLRERHGLATVALSGGVFQNLLLLDRTVVALEAGGFRVLTHSRVPCNDGGISFGQAVVAATRDLAAGR